MSNPLAEYAFQQARCTYMIYVQICYPDQYSESLPGQEENTALLIEEMVAQELLLLFDSVFMDEVKITDVAQAGSVTLLHMLYLNARCPHHAFPANPAAVEMIECTVEQQLARALLQLFDAVEIERVEVRFMPTEYE
jgi:hypothetical protein